MKQHRISVRSIGSFFALALTLVAFSGCAVALVGAGAGAGYVLAQEDRGASETIDDQRIISEVKLKLLGDSAVTGRDINVDSFKRVVTLRGVVRSDEEQLRAIEIAEGVSGVVRVEPVLFIAP